MQHLACLLRHASGILVEAAEWRAREAIGLDATDAEVWLGRCAWEDVVMTLRRLVARQRDACDLEIAPC